MGKNINHIPDFIGTEKFSNFTSFLGQERQFYAKGKVKCKYFSQFTKHPVYFSLIWKVEFSHALMNFNFVEDEIKKLIFLVFLYHFKKQKNYKLFINLPNIYWYK